jgi:hypothetical protein
VDFHVSLPSADTSSPSKFMCLESKAPSLLGSQSQPSSSS